MDGVHLLRKRRHTRLWYRSMPATAQPPMARPTMTSGTDLLGHVATAAEEAVWEEHLSEPLPATALAQPVIAAPVAPVPVDPVPVAAAPELLESVRQTKRIGQPQSAAKEIATPVAAPVSGGAEDEDEWRVVPDTAPSLLLSATDLLDA